MEVKQNNQIIDNFGKWWPVVTIIFAFGVVYATITTMLNGMQADVKDIKEQTRVLDERTVKMAQDVAVLKDRAGLSYDEKTGVQFAGVPSKTIIPHSSQKTTVEVKNEPNNEKSDEETKKEEDKKQIEKVRVDLQTFLSNRIP